MSTLRTNALEGMDAKNSITIVAGAGNITTTNVQEGLAKCFAKWASNSSHAIADSFNTASMTDPGTGVGNANFTNNMSNANFSISATTESMNEAVNFANVSTSAVSVSTYNSSHSATDNAHTTATVHGDLA